jgi:hypothetical protein
MPAFETFACLTGTTDPGYSSALVFNCDFDIRIWSLYELVPVRGRQAEPMKDGPFPWLRKFS